MTEQQQQQQQQQEQQVQNLPIGNVDDTIRNNGANDAQQGAAPSGAEDTQQQGTSLADVISGLIAENQRLRDEMATAIRQGAAFIGGNSQQPAAQQQPTVSPQQATGQFSQIGVIPQAQQSMQEPYVPLKDMDFNLSKSDVME